MLEEPETTEWGNERSLSYEVSAKCHAPSGFFGEFCGHIICKAHEEFEIMIRKVLNE